MEQRGSNSSHLSILSQVLDWYNGARAKWTKLQDVDNLSPDDIIWMAEDVGLPKEQFLELVRQPDGAAGLLHKRLAALGLDPQEIRQLSPLLLGDLQRTCACCQDKERCADDMADDPNPPGWEAYCPNSGTLRTLT